MSSLSLLTDVLLYHRSMFKSIDILLIKERNFYVRINVSVGTSRACFEKIAGIEMIKGKKQKIFPLPGFQIAFKKRMI